MGKPAITVIVPTYNWSAALRCAIESVLLQTVQDFELIVVGDGCTDDSDRVVASFGDERIHWHNLDRNYGSQWAANNFGIERARADWIAYLGHDDVWYPTHLEAVLRAAGRRQADVITSTMIMYGPKDTRWLALAGIFPDGRFVPGSFVPPSAFAHRRELCPSVVQWRDPNLLVTPMDAAFLNDLGASERVFATTGELTCFKFNAAFRRDSYKIKAVDEQVEMLARIKSGVDFRHEELHAAFVAHASGRFGLMGKLDAPPGSKEGEVVQRNRRHKGVDARFSDQEFVTVDRTVRFDMSGQQFPLEWYHKENAPDGASYRWTGPSTRPSIDLPVKPAHDLEVRIFVRDSLVDRRAFLKLSIGTTALDLAVEPHANGKSLTLASTIPVAAWAGCEQLTLTLDTGPVYRPCDLRALKDIRWLGVAVEWVELAPAAAGASLRGAPRPKRTRAAKARGS